MKKIFPAFPFVIKNLIISGSLLFFCFNSFNSFNLNAAIIYLEPVQNAQYVRLQNNIIIGFDKKILNSDLNSHIRVTGSLSGNHTGEIILTPDRKKLIFKPSEPFQFNE